MHIVMQKYNSVAPENYFKNVKIILQSKLCKQSKRFFLFTVNQKKVYYPRAKASACQLCVLV